MTKEELQKLKVTQLREQAAALHLKGTSRMKKEALIAALSELQHENGEQAEKAPRTTETPSSEQPEKANQSISKKRTKHTDKPAASLQSVQVKQADSPQKTAQPASSSEPVTPAEQKPIQKKTGAATQKTSVNTQDAPKSAVQALPDSTHPLQLEEKSEAKEGGKKSIAKSAPEKEKPTTEKAGKAEAHTEAKADAKADVHAKADARHEPEARQELKLQSKAEAKHEGKTEYKNENRNGRMKNSRYAKIKDNINDTVQVTGPLEIKPEGFGLLENKGAEPPYDHIYVSPSQIQKFRLKSGDQLGGKVRSPKQGEKYAAMLFLEMVNGTETIKIIHQMDSLLRADNRESDERFRESHTGILDVNPDGFGFLRVQNYQSGDDDIYIAANQIRRYGLRTGDKVTGKIRKSGESEKNDALLYVERVNGDIPELIAHRPKFEQLLPVFPDERLTLETHRDVFSTRMIDLFSPMGKGQRGMIVAPPKAGKTTLLKEIADGIVTNHPEVELMILLVDERPEEVTDMQRSIDCDIIYSTFDQPAQNHLAAAEMVLERGKRLVEQGKDAVVLVDSLTRLTRANNLCVEPSGRTLSGGIDPEALYFPKKFFGSARNIEGGGSLTIIATALVETGSRMDDIVFEEFKGTGNMEIVLERELAQRRIYPAVNLQKSGTRREDLLLTPKEMRGTFALRKMYGTSPLQMTDKVLAALTKTRSNEDFLDRFVKPAEA